MVHERATSCACGGSAMTVCLWPVARLHGVAVQLSLRRCRLRRQRLQCRLGQGRRPDHPSKKIAHQVGFKVLPRRWVVGRTFAWLNRNRRLAKDFEATIDSTAAFLYAASVMLLGL
jgi:hypothetical protein